MLLLSQTLASRITLLYLSLTSMPMTDLLSKQFTMLLTSQQPKWNFLPLDAASIRLLTYQEYQKLLSSWTLSIQLDLYLTLLSTLSKFTQLLFLRNLGSFSSQITTTQLSSRNALVTITSFSSKLLIEILNSFAKLCFFLANHCRT